MSNAKAVAEEDLTIQDTLAMTVEERLDLIAFLIVDKIINDQLEGQPFYKQLIGESAS